MSLNLTAAVRKARKVRVKAESRRVYELNRQATARAIRGDLSRVKLNFTPAPLTESPLPIGEIRDHKFRC